MRTGFPVLARQLFGNVRLDFADAGSEGRRLQSALLGQCRVSELTAGAHTVYGDHVVHASHDPDMLKLLIQSGGTSLIEQGGRTVEFGAAYPVLYDPVRPYTLVNRTGVRLLMLQVPRHVFSSRAIAVLSSPRRPAGSMARLCHVLKATLQSVLAEAEGLEEPERSRLGNVLIDMARPLVECGVAADPAQPRMLDVLLSRCKSFIADNLCDANLSVERIAAKMGCTPRYVFRAFEADGMTPSQFIWEMRLAQASTELASSLHAGRTISDIAFMLGFSSSAHFSRAFRQRFGQTPRDFRQAAGLSQTR